MLAFNRRHFIAGLIGTWIVGMGRYWDHTNASLLQHLGIGSVIYIFLLAALIWLIVKPYFVKDWTYFRVLTFIALTSFPAIIYAIPVEKYFLLSTANSIKCLVFGLCSLLASQHVILFSKKIYSIKYRLHSCNYIIACLFNNIHFNCVESGSCGILCNEWN